MSAPPPAPRPALAPSIPGWLRGSPWRLVLAVYLLGFGCLLLKTDGYPYVLDNNESYSSWWHARSLFENGVAKTKGLTDEVFSPAPAASPYIHSHQGNFPRLYVFVCYALGLRTIGAQIWVATFTVGLAAVWLAFRFFSRLANPTFAALTCLLLITDYLFFTQWQVGLYNVWHGFFFFSSLSCVQALGATERRGRWFLLAVLNFAALFYWEYVFTAFVSALCGLYSLVLYWRRFRLVCLLAAALAGGAGLAAGTLLLQLSAYMGWANVMEDVRLTLTARNVAADPALLEKVTSFYREHHIIFWHNFLEAAPLRTARALWDSLYEFHLKYYSPALLYAALVLGAGWLLGCWQWAHRSWRRVLPLVALAGLVVWLWPWAAEAKDPTLHAEYALTFGGATLLAAERGLLALVTLVALACAVAGNAAVLGHATGRMAALLPLLVCGAAAYGLTYRIFTGYIYSGYLHRFVPLPVFLTVPLLGLALYVLFQSSWRAWSLAGGPAPSPAARLGRTIPFAVALAAFAGVVAYWIMLQVTYASIAPPDSYAFLQQLERPPFKGRSLVSNTYPAPMAARTGSWGYADTSLFSGILTLTPRGFEVERDTKYLWFADRDTNAAYRKPDLAISLVHSTSLAEAVDRLAEARADLQAGRARIPSGLVRRASSSFQPFLQHRLLHSDGRRLDLVGLDWDYPPYLARHDRQVAAFAAQLDLPRKLAVSASASESRRRWRVEWQWLDAAAGPAPLSLWCDGQPVSFPTVSEGTLIASGDRLRLRLARATGRLRVTVNDASETFDLASLSPAGADFEWNMAAPHGRYTRVPAFSAGFYVETRPTTGAAGLAAEVVYRYAHQENRAQAGTLIRLYLESAPGQWRLQDAVTLLGPTLLPVRMQAFRRENPETLAEYARIAAHGDPRTFEQWLSDHLTAHPEERARPGVAHDVVVSAMSATEEAGTVVRLPLPPAATGRLQFSVSPATRTKAGPEYFGLPFAGQVGKIELQPPEPAAEAPLVFGRLRLRLRFPANHGAQFEPLVTTGAQEAGDFIYVQYVDPGHIRIGFDHWFKGGPITQPIAVDFTQEHALEISMGSLYPPREDVVFVNTPAAMVDAVKNRVIVQLDGQPVIDTAAECYETVPDSVTVGRNAIFGTSSAPEFSGEILSIERLWPDIK